MNRFTLPQSGPATRPAALLGAGLLSVLLLNGCGGESSDGAGLGESLNDRSFLLQSSEGFTPVTGTTVSVSFSDSGFGFNAGCNSFGGAMSLDGNTLRVGGLGSTNIGCDAARSAQDDWLAEFFLSGPALELNGNALSIENSEATLNFLDREVADPDRPLVGTPWSVTSLIMGPVAQAGDFGQPSLQFASDGTLQVFTGCNAGGGQYTTSASSVTLSGMAYDDQACDDQLESMADAHMRQVLSDGSLLYSIDAASLTLMRGDQGLLATAE